VSRSVQATAPNIVRATAWEWAQTALLSANLIWTTLGLGGYRPETMAVTSALTGVLVALHGFRRAFDQNVLPLQTAGCWVLLFLGYAAANVLFVTPVRWLGWFDWLLWANVGAVFWVASNDLRSAGCRRALFGTLVALALTGVALGGYQRFVQPDWLMLGRTQAEQFIGRASGPFGIPNSLAGLLLLVLPPAGALAFRRHAPATVRIWWIWVVAVLALGLVLTLSRGAWLSLMVALGLWPLCNGGWSWTRRLALAVAALGLAAAAVVAVTALLPAARGRVEQFVRDGGEVTRPILWRGAWELFQERPLTGTGAGSFNTAFERHRPAGFRDEPRWAHNEYLNTLSDYGALGAGCLVVALGGLVRARRRGREENSRRSRDALETGSVRTALGIGLFAFAVQMAFDFHLKIPALGMAFAMCAAVWIQRAEMAQAGPVSPALSPWRKAVWCALGVGAVLVTLPVNQTYRGEALRWRAREATHRFAANPVSSAAALASLLAAEAELRRALVLAPGNAQTWADLAFVLQLQAHVNPTRTRDLAAPAIAAARQALALSEAVPEFWIRLGNALDLRGDTPAAAEAFSRAVTLAPRSAYAWYYYAYHVSRDRAQAARAAEAIATCLALDPGNRAAEALREKLNARRAGNPSAP
jgi:O-antigen ligase